MIGKSSCSSVAPSASNRSKTWSTTQSGRAPGRSTLLMTTMGLSPRAKALEVTKRVWGMGPSTASTSSSTESTMDSTRSTSPPKSACPGRIDDVDAVVAVVDRRVLGEDRDAALALLVVGVHDPLGVGAAAVEGAGLPQQAVDKRGLAMVDVGDDGDIAELLDHVRVLDASRRGARGRGLYARRRRLRSGGAHTGQGAPGGGSARAPGARPGHGRVSHHLSASSPRYRAQRPRGRDGRTKIYEKSDN
jgi:hypothetical protein